MFSRLPLVAFACLVGAEVGWISSYNVAGWSQPGLWPPAGIFVAVFLARERRQWPLLALAGLTGVLVSNVGLHGQPWLLAVVMGLAVAAEAAVVAWAINRLLRAPFAASRVSHVWALAGVGTAVPMLAGLAALMLPGPVLEAVGMAQAWRAWWLSDSIGVLVVVPIAFALRDAEPWLAGSDRRWRLAEALLTVLVALGAVQVVFGEAVPPQLRAPAFILPFLLLSAYRLAPGGAMLTLLAVCVLGMWHTVSGRGPYALTDSSPNFWVFRSQVVSLAMSMSILTLASVVAERNAAARESKRLLDELTQALVEIKTLRGMIPICAWCHKVRDDAGFWQRIEGYLQTHTDATFSHSICPGCQTHMDKEIAETRSEASA